MNRETEIIKLRPVLNIDTSNTKAIESFQNNVLRPILKYQHEISLSLLVNEKNFKLEQLDKLNTKELEDYLKLFVQKKADLKNQILGLVIGLFSLKELTYYNLHRKELNKRIIQMQLNRFIDSFSNEKIL